MKINSITATILALSFFSGSSAFAADLESYIQESISGSYRIKSLEAQANVERIRQEQEDKFYLPSLKIDHTTKMHMEDAPAPEGVQGIGGIRPWENRVHESNVNLRSNIWRDNHNDVYDMLSAKTEAADFNVEIQKSNIRAQITTSVYNIYLYEKLIKVGEDILAKAKAIDTDIKDKVEGGLAKASDGTTAQVLITDMDNAILATKLKIKQLKLALEQVSGIPYPETMDINPKDVVTLLSKTPNTNIDNNKALLKKSMEVKAASKAIDATDNWISVDLYAKTKADNLTVSRFDSEVGVMVTMDIFNPSSYWKEKTSTSQYQAEQYMLDQMNEDLLLSLESQLSILDSNRKLLHSQNESIAIKKDLIAERQNEYQINVTSLYELIQAWNGYYSAIQQKTDTEATLVNTLLSIDVLTGEI